MQKYPTNPGPLPVDVVGPTPLKLGSTDDNVKILQTMLFELGYLRGTSLGSTFLDGVSGEFDQETKKGVETFQHDHPGGKGKPGDWEGKALAVDCEVGERTGDALNREMVGVWYAVYISEDKDGNLVPTDLPLATVDIDSPIKVPQGLFKVEVHVDTITRSAAERDPDLKLQPDRSVRFIPNDPSADGNPDPPKEVFLLNLHPPDGQTVPTWRIEDSPGSGFENARTTAANPLISQFPAPGRSDTGTTQFQQGNTHVTIARTLRTWRLRGFRPDQWRGGRLNVTLQDPNQSPHLNGGFTDGTPPTLKLGFRLAGGGLDDCFDAESAEFISHETTHGIINALFLDLWNDGRITVNAFHESIADIGAMLTTFSDPDVRAAWTGGDPSASNLVSKWSEQAGTTLANLPAGDPDSPFNNTNPDCLRDAVNNFIYQNPDPPFPAALPPGSQFQDTLFSEMHSFARVFTGAFYDSIVSAFKRLKPNADTPDDAARQAVGTLGTILCQAIKNQPNPRDGYYRVLAREMFRIDKVRFAQEFRADLRGFDAGTGIGFVGRNIITDAQVNEVSPES
jgi:hypothetical protein